MSTLTFEYHAVDQGGRRSTGTAVGASEAEVFRKLKTKGLTPLRLRASEAASAGEPSTVAGTAAAAPGPRARRRAIKTKDLAHFTAQLGVLVQARIPIADGLQSIAEQETDLRLKAVITDIARRIEAGESLANAMDAHRAVWGEVYIQTIRAAEKSGNLTKVLDHLSEMLERSEETRRQVKNALTYPACVAGVMVIGVFFLLGFVIPRFAKMFASRGVELPLLTQVMMGAGSFVQAYWWLIIAAAVAAVFAVRRVASTPAGNAWLDAVLYRVPVVGRMLTGLAISRFAHVMGLSLSSGLGLLDSLDLAGRAAARPMLQAEVQRMSAEVRGGRRLTAAMDSSTYFTPFCRRMFSAGETSGELPRMCSIVARQYDRETSQLSKSLATLIEPIMIVSIAGIVLVVALSIFLPMWEMVNLVK